MSFTLFYMCEAQKDYLISRHNFYIEQAKKRLLSQFQNKDTEAEEYAKEWLNSRAQYFDPDRHDPSSFYEEAHEESIGLYLMLSEMETQIRLSVVAGIFHEWEKQLRDWIVKEINHWHSGHAVKKAVWKANFCMIIDLLEGFEWPIKSKNYHASLDRCRLVVNTFKHGSGKSLDDIKEKHPDFIGSIFIESNEPKNFSYIDHTNLKVEEHHIQEFSNAILEFWQDVPEYIFDKDEFVLPDWFMNAYNKDRSATN